MRPLKVFFVGGAIAEIEHAGKSPMGKAPGMDMNCMKLTHLIHRRSMYMNEQGRHLLSFLVSMEPLGKICFSLKVFK